MKSSFLSASVAFAISFNLHAADPPKGDEDRIPPDAEKVEIAIDAPATNYRIDIMEIRKVGEELWVFSKVSTVGDIGGDAITRIKDSVLLEKTGLPHKHFVAGKTWRWEEPKTVTYLPEGEGMKGEKWSAGKPVFAQIPDRAGKVEGKE